LGKHTETRVPISAPPNRRRALLPRPNPHPPKKHLPNPATPPIVSLAILES